MFAGSFLKRQKRSPSQKTVKNAGSNVPSGKATLSPNERKKLRKQRLAPLLKNFWQCLAELPALPQSMLGKAIKYADGQKTAIDKLLQYGALDLSNNTCEQAIKSLIIDRKNFLSSTSIAGAKANAIWLTLIESAKANGLDPLQYLFDILNQAL
ncbi:transposase [Ligilactobacillus acidipiscis]|nr:transposase [Ligilactobacillus acidipiscis]WEV56570.1 transposase [Ligilactobacillus acidipiscis]